MKMRSTALGFAVLLVLSSADAAQSLSGSNTVLSDDIKAGNVLSSDIGTDAVSGAKVKDGSITGNDINESTLTPVPSAKTVNGLALTSIKATMAQDAGAVTLFSDGANTILLRCYSNVSVQMSKGASTSRMTYAGLWQNGVDYHAVPPREVDLGATISMDSIQLKVTNDGSAGSHVIDFTAWKPKALGDSSTTDCFVRGTITKLP